MLYWRISHRINHEILKEGWAEYGKRILATLSQQLSWSHFRELLPQEKTLQREFYAEMCRIEHWSVRTLRKKIDSILFTFYEEHFLFVDYSNFVTDLSMFSSVPKKFIGACPSPLLYVIGSLSAKCE